MKRILFLVACAVLVCGSAFSQDAPQYAFMKIIQVPRSQAEKDWNKVLIVYETGETEVHELSPPSPVPMTKPFPLEEQQQRSILIAEHVNAVARKGYQLDFIDRIGFETIYIFRKLKP